MVFNWFVDCMFMNFPWMFDTFSWMFRLWIEIFMDRFKMDLYRYFPWDFHGSFHSLCFPDFPMGFLVGFTQILMTLPWILTEFPRDFSQIPTTFPTSLACQPCSAKALAAARPRPLEAPVMTTVFLGDTIKGMASVRWWILGSWKNFHLEDGWDVAPSEGESWWKKLSLWIKHQPSWMILNDGLVMWIVGEWMG